MNATELAIDYGFFRTTGADEMETDDRAAGKGERWLTMAMAVLGRGNAASGLRSVLQTGLCQSWESEGHVEVAIVASVD